MLTGYQTTTIVETHVSKFLLDISEFMHKRTDSQLSLIEQMTGSDLIFVKWAVELVLEKRRGALLPHEVENWWRGIPNRLKEPTEVFQSKIHHLNEMTLSLYNVIAPFIQHIVKDVENILIMPIHANPLEAFYSHRVDEVQINDVTMAVKLCSELNV